MSVISLFHIKLYNSAAKKCMFTSSLSIYSPAGLAALYLGAN